MINSTLGAPFGGTTRGGHQGLESLALSLITPPNLVGGGGSCLPSIVIVALGEPGVPLICWAIVPDERVVPRRMPDARAVAILFIPLLLKIAHRHQRASTYHRKKRAITGSAGRMK